MPGPDEWVVLELNPRSEGEDPDTIRASIQKAVPKTEVFLPAVVTQIGDDAKVHYLYDGYAFVCRGDYPDSAFLRLESTRFVQGVLLEPGTYGRHRRLSVVKTSDIDKMRQQIQSQVHQGIGIGDKVQITTGPYRNMEATVIEEIPEQKLVQVFVKLRSKQSIVTIPRSGLLVLERAPLSPLLSRLTDLRAWLRQVRPVVLWQGGQHVPALQQLYGLYDQVVTWLSRGRRLFSVASFERGAHDEHLAQIRSTYEKLKRNLAWNKRFSPLFSLIQSYVDDSANVTAMAEIQSKLVTLAWMEDVEERIKKLAEDVDGLGHHHTANGRVHEDGHVIQNVLVDGHNLAFRCAYAPGMSEIQDSNGRPTGVILGVLRSLGSLKKRCPEARLYIAWDGASRRRKKVFDAYKANRPARNAESVPVFNQMEALQKVLPLLGVRQLFNGEEEADDTIAAVVRGELNSQNNLIFSSDRDLLQLVTSRTKMLVPGSGIRKEILYDEALVLENFGVPPSKLLQLRAFYGDTSDNIPGVPRVPKKVLCSLVQAHGSVEQVYKSGLTGLSKGQYERLRASEPQVKINLSLMALVDVPVTVTDPDVDVDLASSTLRELEINPNPILEALGLKVETEA